MQYMHRRLQRSVTERRRLASGRPSASRTTTDGACVRAVRIGATISTKIPPNDARKHSQCAARVLSVRPFLAYTDVGICLEESRFASLICGVAAAAGGG